MEKMRSSPSLFLIEYPFLMQTCHIMQVKCAVDVVSCWLYRTFIVCLEYSAEELFRLLNVHLPLVERSLRGPGEDKYRGISHFISCSLTALSDNENFAPNGQLNSLIYWQISGRSFFIFSWRASKGSSEDCERSLLLSFSISVRALQITYALCGTSDEKRIRLMTDLKWFPQLPVFIFCIFLDEEHIQSSRFTGTRHL